jgi:hypothetical protein
LWVGAAVVNPLVDFVADSLGEAGDFAVAFVAAGDADNILDFGFLILDLGRGRGVSDCYMGIHKILGFWVKS